MVEVGIADPRANPVRYEGDPRDAIELNHDIYKPSALWSSLSQAIQKDMVLANLSGRDMLLIRYEFQLIETLLALYRRDPVKYKALENTMNDEMTSVANLVTVTRGFDGFTAKLMRKTIQEQHQTMGYEMGREKQKQAQSMGGKAKNFLGF